MDEKVKKIMVECLTENFDLCSMDGFIRVTQEQADELTCGIDDVCDDEMREVITQNIKRVYNRTEN